MRESEIKRAIEKINWNVSGVKCIIDDVLQCREITAEDLTRDCKLLDESVTLVESLCNYMIDDGSVDMSEELEAVLEEANRTICGEYGRVPENALTDETKPLFDRIMGNLTSIVFEISDYYAWIEAKRGGNETQNVENTPPKPLAKADSFYDLFTAGHRGNACDLADTINDAIQAYTPRKGQGYNKEIARIISPFYDKWHYGNIIRSEYAYWQPFLKFVTEAMGLQYVRYDKGQLR